MKRTILRPAASALLLMLSMNGCYTYSAAELATPERGARLRVQLSTPRDVPLGEIVARDVALVVGEVIRADEDSVALSAFRLETPTGFEHQAVGQTVVVPRADIAGVERRRLSAWRSVLFGGAIVGILAAVGAVAGEGGAEGSFPPNGGSAQ